MRRALLLLACAVALPACGDSGGGTIIVLPAPPQSAPTGVTVVVGDGELTLHWNAVFQATRYTIYGATSPGVTPANALSLAGGMKVDGLVVSPHTFSGLTNGTTYYFIVAAANDGGEGPPSGEVSGTPVPLPGAPTGVTASAGNQSVQLNWTPVPFATSYNVYRATVTGVTPANYLGLAGGAKSTNVPRPFTAASLTNGTTYYFVVTAVNAMGESVGSTEVSAMPVPPPPPAPTGFVATRGNAQVTLNWANVTGATSYTVYGATATGVTPANYAGHPGGFRIQNAVRPVIVSPLTNGTAYYFIVTASNAGGEGAASTQISSTPIPPPPAPTSPLAVGGDGTITLTWTASPTATSYVVYSAEVPGVTPANWASLAGGRRVPVSGSPYERRGLSTGTTLYFVVSGVNDVGEGVPSAQVSAAATGGGTSEPTLLPYRPIDAEYNRSNDTIVAVSAFPHRLHITDPVTLATTTVGLPLEPLCVSVGPTGTHAAVGHDGWISYINLGTATLDKTLRVPAVPFDIVLAGNGFAYVSPANYGLQPVHCINIASGAITGSTGASVYRGYLKLHAGGTAMYGGSTGTSPSDVFRYDLGSGTANYAGDSPYHGTYPSGGPVWLSEDGQRIFTRSGTVFRTLLGGAGEMTYNGALSQTTLIQSLDHRTVTGNIAAVPESSPSGGAAFADTELHLYTSAFLAFDRKFTLPPFRVGGNTYASHGRFAFIHGDGTRCFVVVRADTKSGLTDNHGLMEVSLSSTPVSRAPTGMRLQPSSSTSALASWDAQPGATNYKLYWATMSGVLPGNQGTLPNGGTSTLPSSSTFGSISGLPSGATIYAVVTAVTGGIEGPPSPEASMTLQPSPSFAPAPTGITVTPGNGQLTIAWTASVNATSYVVYGARKTGVDAASYGTLPGGFRIETASSPAVLSGLVNDQVYFLRLAARNGAGDQGTVSEFSAIPTTAAAPPLRPLAYRVADSEFSAALNKIVSISTVPNMLRLHDPTTLAETSVALPTVPACVSVSPDGLTAAVGYNGFVSHVDLQTTTVLNTWSVPVNVFDLVLAGNGFAYINPAAGQWVQMVGVNMATGSTSTSSGSVRHQTYLKLHASGTSIYGGDTDVSPADVEKYSISGATITVLYDSPYHGDFAAGGNLWTSADGLFLVARAGTRFSTTAAQATDLLYEGRLADTGMVASVAHSSATGRIAAVPFASPDDGRVHWLDDFYTGTIKASAIPKFNVGGTPYPAHGKFVFFSSDGTKAHVVVMADAASGLLNDFAVVTFE